MDVLQKFLLGCKTIPHRSNSLLHPQGPLYMSKKTDTDSQYILDYMP